MPGGRPSKYDPKTTPLKAEICALKGMIDVDIAAELEICLSTLYEWKNKFPEFSESLKKNKDIIDARVEDSLLKRAMGYEYDEKTISANDVKTVTKTVLPDVTAQIFWLKNRQPEKWRDKKEVELDTDVNVIFEIKGE